MLIIFLTGLGNVVGFCCILPTLLKLGTSGAYRGFPGFGKNGPFGGGSAPRNN